MKDVFKTFTVRGRLLKIEEDYAAFFKKYICVSIEEMAEVYLCAEFKTNEIEAKLATLSDSQIMDIIRLWAEADLSGMGIKYADA